MDPGMKNVFNHFSEKVSQVASNLPLLRDAMAMFRLLKDPGAHWADKAVVVSALAYFILPMDAMPDVAPIVGYLDDAGVIAAGCLSFFC